MALVDAFPLALMKIKTLGTSSRDIPMLTDSWSLPDSRVWRVDFTGYQRHKGSEFPSCLTCRLKIGAKVHAMLPILERGLT